MDIIMAYKIAYLIGFADRGCPNCVADMVEHANRIFPDYIFEQTELTAIEPSEWDTPDYKGGPTRIVVLVKQVAFPTSA